MTAMRIQTMAVPLTVGVLSRDLSALFQDSLVSLLRNAVTHLCSLYEEKPVMMAI
jgi:hypothetical protein